MILKTPNTFNSDFYFIYEKCPLRKQPASTVMERPKKKDKIEMGSLVESGENSVKNSPSGDDEKQNLQVPVSGQTYGSTLSIGPEASTANLLKIDLDKKISRHTGKRYLTIYYLRTSPLREMEKGRGYFLVDFQIKWVFSKNYHYCMMVRCFRYLQRWTKTLILYSYIHTCMYTKLN